MTLYKLNEVLEVVEAEDVDEVEGAEEPVVAVEEGVVGLPAGHVEVKEAPLIQEYADYMLSKLLSENARVFKLGCCNKHFNLSLVM